MTQAFALNAELQVRWFKHIRDSCRSEHGTAEPKAACKPCKPRLLVCSVASSGTALSKGQDGRQQNYITCQGSDAQLINNLAGCGGETGRLIFETNLDLIDKHKRFDALPRILMPGGRRKPLDAKGMAPWLEMRAGAHPPAMQLQKPSRRTYGQASGAGNGRSCGSHVKRCITRLRGARVPIAAVADDRRSQLARAVKPQLVLPACARLTSSLRADRKHMAFSGKASVQKVP